ncbi:multiple myeloma tumor-associated protein 2 homolog [Acropora palmata]|uniref:multiple myeloma tumor-associated protein 2 homolog n=1 Tax=Acropora palmata TaxID=6131 RepID=UPI003DA02052
MYHPSRGGVRGGQDQFDWEDVKGDKHRENYLGHSVKAPVGRWQKGKDLHWYTKSGKIDSAVTKQQEKDAIKKMEAEALAIALGKGNSTKRAGGVTKQELAEVCRKGQLERDSMDIERVEGMGFSSSRVRLMDMSSAPVRETLGATCVQEASQVSGGLSRGNEKTVRSIFPGQVQVKDANKEKVKKKKEKKSKKEKKHKRKQSKYEESSEEEGKTRRKRKREDDKKRTKNDSQSFKSDKYKKDFKWRKNYSSSSSDSSNGKDNHRCSKSHHNSYNYYSSNKDIARTSRENRRSSNDEKSKQRRQRHDTE